MISVVVKMGGLSLSSINGHPSSPTPLKLTGPEYIDRYSHEEARLDFGTLNLFAHGDASGDDVHVGFPRFKSLSYANSEVGMAGKKASNSG